MQHIKRNGKVSPNITSTSNTKYEKSQDELLDNQNNKAHLIAGLSNHLSKMVPRSTSVLKMLIQQ